ncbi:TetR/AcrR family transcriptional regulator [Nocardia sp. 852002-20019_SCH5090214]|uniref:TetR/AcrR family transcriptional regulator n=1 Tax=Nocardia sp. 852002-20019_SCH5090214 TaxID=1834087 RepID=UPI0007EBF65C|nr:TetR/AcrR family transcriptional regulator [Nocardia sp. 852002-20019_SCH5090214]
MSGTARQVPRKIPRQERSRRMVERILDSCARLLIAGGYDGVSTHRIAADAGISSGSLYQYFPNKDAIVAMTVERMIGEIAGGLLSALTAGGAGAPEQQVRAAVAAALDLTEQNRELVRVLVEQMPRLGGSTELKIVEQRAGDLIAGYLAAVTRAGDPGRAFAMAWMAFHAFQQIIIRYVLDRPAIPREQFVDELTRLLITFTGRRR